nr:hypothetical protein DM860_003399 [Ipomoea batatas]
MQKSRRKVAGRSSNEVKSELVIPSADDRFNSSNEILGKAYLFADCSQAAGELILNGVSDDDPAVLGGVTEGYVSRARDVEVVTAGGEGPDSPLNAAVKFNGDPNGAGVLVLTEVGAVKRRNGDVIAVDKRGPEVSVLVALVYRRDNGVIGDLLVVVGGEGVELVVVDADAAVGVVGGDGDLDGGGEDVGGGDVEVVDVNQGALSSFGLWYVRLCQLSGCCLSRATQFPCTPAPTSISCLPVDSSRLPSSTAPVPSSSSHRSPAPSLSMSTNPPLQQVVSSTSFIEQYLSIGYVIQGFFWGVIFLKTTASVTPTSLSVYHGQHTPKRASCRPLRHLLYTYLSELVALYIQTIPGRIGGLPRLPGSRPFHISSWLTGNSQGAL